MHLRHWASDQPQTATMTNTMTEFPWTYELTGTQQLVDARGRLDAHLSRNGIDGTTAGDAALIISELCTNAFEHDRADAITVAITVNDTAIVIETHHRSSNGELDLTISNNNTEMPPPTDERGRGLAIVATLATNHEIRVDQGRHHNHVTIHR